MEGLGANEGHQQLFMCLCQALQSSVVIYAQQGQGSYESSCLFTHVHQEQEDKWQQHLKKKADNISYYLSNR